MQREKARYPGALASFSHTIGKPWQANGGPLSGIAPWPVAQIQQWQRIFSAFLNQKNIAALSNLQYSVLLHAVTPIRSSKTAKPI